MKRETRIKLQSMAEKLGNVIREWGVPLLIGTTIAAAWDGHVRAQRNEREIRRLTHNQNVFRDVVNENAVCLGETMDRVTELENRNQELLDQALKETEGASAA